MLPTAIKSGAAWAIAASRHSSATSSSRQRDTLGRVISVSSGARKSQRDGGPSRTSKRKLAGVNCETTTCESRHRHGSMNGRWARERRYPARPLMVGSVVTYIWPTDAPRISGAAPVYLADAAARGAGRLRSERTIQDSARRRDGVAAGQPRRSSPWLHVPG